MQGSVGDERGGLGESSALTGTCFMEFGAGWNLIFFLEKCNVNLCWRDYTLKVRISEAADRIV